MRRHSSASSSRQAIAANGNGAACHFIDDADRRIERALIISFILSSSSDKRTLHRGRYRGRPLPVSSFIDNDDRRAIFRALSIEDIGDAD